MQKFDTAPSAFRLPSVSDEMLQVGVNALGKHYNGLRDAKPEAFEAAATAAFLAMYRRLSVELQARPERR